MAWKQRSCPGSPNCQHTVTGNQTYCDEHTQQLDQARGNRHQRGYGTTHQREGTKALQGATHCATCGQPFTPNNPATRGHNKDIRKGGTETDGYKAECQHCNYGWRRKKRGNIK